MESVSFEWIDWMVEVMESGNMTEGTDQMSHFALHLVLSRSHIPAWCVMDKKLTDSGDKGEQLTEGRRSKSL